MDEVCRQVGVSAADFELICGAYRKLVNGRQIGDAEARKLAADLIRDLTDAVELDQDLVRHIIERSDRG
jgi:hypothetical protein